MQSNSANFPTFYQQSFYNPSLPQYPMPSLPYLPYQYYAPQAYCPPMQMPGCFLPKQVQQFQIYGTQAAPQSELPGLMSANTLPPVKNESQKVDNLPTQLSEEKQNEERPELMKVETVRQMKRTLNSAQQNRRGHWTNEEHYKYLKFVRQHKELFQTSVQKKLNRVFKMMSIEIPSRTACQCRSHYSKFNPFDKSQKVRRKLVNDEDVYHRMFEDQADESQ